MSRMGTAVVTEIDGLPCFSLPMERATRSGLRLQVLYVAEKRSPDNGMTLPAELWHIRSVNTANAPLLRPSMCIRYGDAPPGMVERTKKTLELFHPYHIAIRQQSDGSGTVAYTAEFCLKPDANGLVRVLVIPNDGSTDEMRFSRCAPPN